MSDVLAQQRSDVGHRASGPQILELRVEDRREPAPTVDERQAQHQARLDTQRGQRVGHRDPGGQR